MTSTQKITLLDQVQKISAANKVILDLCKEVSELDRRPLIDIVYKLLEAGDIINQIGAEPAVNIETTTPCLS